MDDQWTAHEVRVQVTGHDSNITFVIYIGKREAPRAKDLTPVASGHEVLRFTQDDKCVSYGVTLRATRRRLRLNIASRRTMAATRTRAAIGQ